MTDDATKAALSKNDRVAQEAGNAGLLAMAAVIEDKFSDGATEAERIACMNSAAIMVLSTIGDQLTECLLKSMGDPTHATWRALAAMFLLRHDTDVGGVLTSLHNQGVLSDAAPKEDDNEEETE